MFVATTYLNFFLIVLTLFAIGLNLQKIYKKLNELQEDIEEIKIKVETPTEEKDYNGWTNYATWNIALWLGSDEDMYRRLELILDGEGTIDEKAEELTIYVLCYFIHTGKFGDIKKLQELVRVNFKEIIVNNLD